MVRYQIKKGRYPMDPVVKFYGVITGTIGLWLSTKVREHLDTERVDVVHDPETGKIIIRARHTGLKITDNGFISASGFVRRFDLVPKFGFNYNVSTKVQGEIQFIVLERSTVDDQERAPVPSY